MNRLIEVPLVIPANFQFAYQDFQLPAGTINGVRCTAITTGNADVSNVIEITLQSQALGVRVLSGAQTLVVTQPAMFRITASKKTTLGPVQVQVMIQLA